MRVAARVSGLAILDMILAAERYADAYRALYDSPIGEDGVLGPAFTQILSGLIQLLNGELGVQDGGKLDRKIRQIAFKNAITEEI